MFFQETTPDTSGYMIAGYAIAFLVMALYVASIYLRNRNLNEDMKTLEEMEESAPPVQAAPAKQPRKGTSTSANNKSAKPVTKRPRKV
ncbi:MAG TPA: hypothetical protein VK897_13195 [Anaerolineales bacterium]|nr:hypothetical protein [Anaerolineales bacterium]